MQKLARQYPKEKAVYSSAADRVTMTSVIGIVEPIPMPANLHIASKEKALVAANPVEVPDTLHQEQKQKLEEDVKNRLKQQGLDDKAIAEYKEKWASEMDEESKFLIQSSFLIDALASKYDLKASKEDLEAKMKTYALQSGIDLEKLMEFYNTPDRRSQLSYQITEDKVIQMLADKAKVKEVPKDKLSN